MQENNNRIPSLDIMKSIFFLLIINVSLITCKSTPKKEADELHNKTSEVYSENYRSSAIIGGDKVNNAAIPLGWPWRGVAINSTNFDIDTDLREIKDLGANFVSIYLKPKAFQQKSNLGVSSSFENNFAFIDSVLDKCKSLDMYAMIYFSDFPSDRNKNFKAFNTDFWDNEKELNLAFAEIKSVIDRFKNRGDELQAYQFIGEPLLKLNGKNIAPPKWNDFFKRVFNYLQENDTSRYLIYAPGPGGGANGFKDIEPIVDSPKIIYSLHYYEPLVYTHQGIKHRKTAYEYPGRIRLKYWDKDAVENSLAPLLHFRDKYNKLILVGEFSAIYSAKGWENYLEDILSVFEEKQFSYAYNKWNGYPGWALSNTTQVESKEQKKRIDILATYWKLNQSSKK